MFLLLFALISATSVNGCTYGDYCWCDYTPHSVPPDAVAFEGSTGDIYHICEVFHSPTQQWIPCMVLPNGILLDVPYFDTQLIIQSGTHVHVLCSDHDDSAFQWVSTTTQHLFLLSQRYQLITTNHPIEGQIYYIGLLKEHGIGPVLPKSRWNNHEGFTVTSGGGHHHHHSFEVLTFQQQYVTQERPPKVPTPTSAVNSHPILATGDHGTSTSCNPYCWTDFHGVVPSNAVPVGSDKNGSPVYIGEVQLHIMDDVWLPCMILPHLQSIAFNFIEKNLKTSPAMHVNILCSFQNSKSFKWVQTKSDNIQDMRANYQLIVPPHRPDFLYGQVTRKGQMYIGAVFPPSPSRKFHGLVINNAKEFLQYTWFDVLVYQPDEMVHVI